MNYRNMNISELVREAEATGNALALEIYAKSEAAIEEATEELEDLVEELVSDYAKRVEEALEEHNKEYYLNPESDHTNSIVDLIMDTIDGVAVERVIDEIKADHESPYRASPLTDEATAFLLNLDDDGKEELAQYLYDVEGFKVEVNHGFDRVPFTLASTVIGEIEEDLEDNSWLEEVPEAIRGRVMAKVTGAEGGTVYYHYNAYDTVDLIADFDAIENWVHDRLEDLAA